MLAVIGIAAILAVAAAPLLRDFLLEARMTSAVNALVHTIQFARHATHLQQRDVTICRRAASTAMQCAANGNWSGGWIAFANLDRDEPPIVDAGEPILQVTSSQRLASITSNRRAYVLRPFSLRATNGTVIFCDERGAAAARAVIVSYTGRPRVSRRDSSGRPLACPG